MIQNIIKGRGFRGVCAYVTEKDKSYRLRCGTMAGTNLAELSGEAGAFRRLNPRLGKAAWHTSVSLPPGEELSDQEWEEFANEYMSQMGFGDAPWFASRHQDTDHQHIHIVALRIDANGKTVSDSQDFKKGAEILQDFEKKFGLTKAAKTPWEAWQMDERAIKKGEVDTFRRTGSMSDKEQLKEIIKISLKNSPSVGVFVEDMEMSGVSVLPNVSKKTGHVSGISFELNGTTVKGSSLGKMFSWGGLQKGGLQYDKVRDSFLLIAIKEAHDNEHESKNETTNKSSSLADQKADSGAAGTEGGNYRGAGQEDRTTSPIPVSTGRGSNKKNKQDKQRDPDSSQPNKQDSGGSGRENQREDLGHVRSGGAGPEGHQKAQQPNSEAGEQGEGQDPKEYDFDALDGHIDRDTSWSRIVDLAAQSLQYYLKKYENFSINKTKEDKYKEKKLREVEQILDACYSGLEGMKYHQQQKIIAWRKQHFALQAPLYRITIMKPNKDDKGGKGTRNLGKNKFGEKFFTADEVEQKIPYLSMKNAQDHNIYITPISNDEHYVFLDDTSKNSIYKLKENYGINPCLILESSPNNFQAIYRAKGPNEDINADEERKIGNAFVRKLNQEAGDPNLSGIRHSIRMAGFSNIKMKYRQENDYRPYVKVIKNENFTCKHTSYLFQQARDLRKKQKKLQTLKQEKQKIEKEKIIRLKKIDKLNKKETFFNVENSFARHWKKIEKLCEYKGWEKDYSKIDYRAVKDCLKEGFDIYEVINALIQNSPNIVNRHNNLQKYAEDTVFKAANDKEVILAKAQRSGVQSPRPSR